MRLRTRGVIVTGWHGSLTREARADVGHRTLVLWTHPSVTSVMWHGGSLCYRNSAFLIGPLLITLFIYSLIPLFLQPCLFMLFVMWLLVCWTWIQRQNDWKPYSIDLTFFMNEIKQASKQHQSTSFVFWSSWVLWLWGLASGTLGLTTYGSVKVPKLFCTLISLFVMRSQ